MNAMRRCSIAMSNAKKYFLTRAAVSQWRHGFQRGETFAMSRRATPLRLFLVEDNPRIRHSPIEHIEYLLPAEVIAWDHSEDGV